MIKCPDCDSIVILGIPERGNGKCHHCHGRGTVSVPILGATDPCPFCEGTAQCPRCGGQGRIQGPPDPPDRPRRQAAPESPPPPRSEIVQEWYRLCNESEFIPSSTVNAYDVELKASGRRVAIDVGLEHFTEYTCRQCGDAGYFKVHFLGRLAHPSCGWKAYMGPGSYIGYQTLRVFRVGFDIASERNKDGTSGGIVGFLLGAVFRAVIALFLIPLQMLVGLCQAKQPRSEFVTRIVVLAAFGIGLVALAYRSHERPGVSAAASSVAAKSVVRAPENSMPQPVRVSSAPSVTARSTVVANTPVDDPPRSFGLPPKASSASTHEQSAVPPTPAASIPEQSAAVPTPPSGPPPTGVQGPPKFYRIGNGVSAPTVVRNVEPQYSEEARRAKWQGTVVVSVVVTEQGLPEELKVTRSLGMGLDEKAIEAVRQWRFNPGRKDGKPVPVLATIEVNFRLL